MSASLKRVIITGATGAIGTALIDELVQREIEVLIFQRKGSKRNSIIKEHPLVHKKDCSLQELSQMENDTEKQYDVFFHFAWEGTVGVVQTLNEQKQSLTINVELFGRETPVEISFSDIKKM